MTSDRWGDNWLAIGRAGSVRVDVPGIGRRGDHAHRRLVDLPAGSPVVLSAAAPGAAYRCRALAASCGIELERSYLAFPSASRPAYLVEDAPASADLFMRTVLVAPPRSRLTAPISAALALLRLLRAWRLLRMAAPGRLIVGRRV